jgi:hypothetical protein
MLSIINKHSRDDFIQRDEKTHTYYVQGDSRTYISVTKIISSLFRPFDSEGIALGLCKKNFHDSSSEYYHKNKDEIIETWKSRAKLGTILHQEIENYYNGIESFSTSTIEHQYFLNFLKDFQQCIPYRSEWMIYSEDYHCAGTIDMVFKKKNGHYIIVDWKRCKNVTTENTFGTKPIHPILKDLPDTNFYHYSCQCNFYKYILESKYEMTVDKMYICVLHPENENYQLYELPDMQEEIQKILIS